MIAPREIAELLDKQASIELLPGVTFRVTIKDGRAAYGRLDVLVTPEAGEGEAWVSADRVRVKGAK